MEDNKLNNLYHEFPRLYGTPDHPQVGFACGPGWYQLLHDLSSELISVIYSDCRVTQIKEKYGTLRYYVDFANDAAWDIIEKYENKSGTICEECGQYGSRQVINGWVCTLCDEHFKQRSSRQAV